MTAIHDYRIDFTRRTKEILQDSYPFFEEKDREVTFLLNCLLGLIVAISENEKKANRVFRNNIDDKFLDRIPGKIGFVEKNVKQTNVCDMRNIDSICLRVCHKSSLKGKMTKMWFINKLRNCIAHQNIESINENGIWTGVRLTNINPSYVKDFEVVFTIEELRSFAIFLSEKFIGGIGK